MYWFPFSFTDYILYITTMRSKTLKKKGLTCSKLYEIIELRSNYICLFFFHRLIMIKKEVIWHLLFAGESFATHFHYLQIKALYTYFAHYLLLRCLHDACVSIRVMNTLVHLRPFFPKFRLKWKSTPKTLHRFLDHTIWL